MRKIFSFLVGVGLPMVTCAILAGCQSDQKESPASSYQPAPQATVSSAVSAAPAAPVQTVATAQAVPAMATTVRIKAGSTVPFKDSSGNVWLPDQGFDNSDTVERPDAPITGTKDPGLYQSEHYSMSSFSCKIPNGKYTAKLHFCETFESITDKGERVFSYNVQGHEFKDFDVFAKSGGANHAYVETVPVEVTNGVFRIDFTSNIENPQINAIEITPRS